MAYNKTIWEDGVTLIDAQRMNNLEQGVFNNDARNKTTAVEMNNTIDNVVKPKITAVNKSVSDLGKDIDNKFGAVNSRLDVTKETKTGPCVSFANTLASPLEVEILGNTIQGSDLADIKSTGKLLHNGMYEYEVTVCGENLFNPIYDPENWNDGVYVYKKIYLEPNTTYSTYAILKKIPSGLPSGSQVVLNISTKGYWEMNDPGAIKCEIFNALDGRDSVGKVYNKTFSTGGRSEFYLQYYQNGIGSASSIDVNQWFDKMCDISIIKQSSPISSYVPYVGKTVKIQLPVQLESVAYTPDVLYFNREKQLWCVTKNICNYTFNGTEIISKANDDKVNCTRFDIRQEFKCIPNLKKGTNQKILSSVVVGKTPYTADEELIFNGDYALVINISKSKLSSDTDIGGREYLKGTTLKYIAEIPEEIELPRNTQLELNALFNNTTVLTLSGDVPASVKVTADKSLGATLESHSRELRDIKEYLANIEGLKESQELEYRVKSNYVENKNTINGAVNVKSISGKSLVNIAKIKSTQFEGRIMDIANDLPKGTKKITVKFKTTTNTTSKGICLLIQDVNEKVTYYQPQKPGVAGEFIDFFTSSEDIKKVSLYLQTDDYAVGKAVIDNIMVVEGHEKIYGYWEGIRSIGDVSGIDIATNNDNLLDARELLKNSGSVFDMGDGLYKFRTDFDLFNKGYTIDVPGQVTFSCKAKLDDTTTNFRLGLVYSDGSFTSSNYCTDSSNFVSMQIVSDPNKTPRYIRLDWSNQGYVYIKDLCLNKGNKVNFIKNKVDKKPVLFKDTDGAWKRISQLKSSCTRFYDTIEEHPNGKLYYHIRTKIFSGSDLYGITKEQTFESKDGYYALITPERQGLKFNTTIEENRIPFILCDKLNAVGSDIVTNGNYSEVNCIAYDPRYTVVRIALAKGTNINSFLTEKNIKFIVPVKEEVYEVNILTLMSYNTNTYTVIKSGDVSCSDFRYTASTYLPGFVQDLSDRVKQLEEFSYKTNAVNLTIGLTTLNNELQLNQIIK